MIRFIVDAAVVLFIVNALDGFSLGTVLVILFIVGGIMGMFGRKRENKDEEEEGRPVAYHFSPPRRPGQMRGLPYGMEAIDPRKKDEDLQPGDIEYLKDGEPVNFSSDGNFDEFTKKILESMNKTIGLDPETIGKATRTLMNTGSGGSPLCRGSSRPGPCDQIRLIFNAGTTPRRSRPDGSDSFKLYAVPDRKQTEEPKE